MYLGVYTLQDQGLICGAPARHSDYIKGITDEVKELIEKIVADYRTVFPKKILVRLQRGSRRGKFKIDIMPTLSQLQNLLIIFCVVLIIFCVVLTIFCVVFTKSRVLFHLSHN